MGPLISVSSARVAPPATLMVAAYEAAFMLASINTDRRMDRRYRLQVLKAGIVGQIIL